MKICIGLDRTMFKKHASFQQHIDNMSQAQKKESLGFTIVCTGLKQNINMSAIL